MGISNDFPSKLLGDKGNPMSIKVRSKGPTTGSLSGNQKAISSITAASFGPFDAGAIVAISADVDAYFRFAPDATTAQLTSGSNGVVLGNFNPPIEYEVPSGYRHVGIVGTSSGSGSVFVVD